MMILHHGDGDGYADDAAAGADDDDGASGGGGGGGGGGGIGGQQTSIVRTSIRYLISPYEPAHVLRFTGRQFVSHSG